jgi:hypothetical protein
MEGAHDTVRPVATLLGGAGLAPFIAFSAATWIDPETLGGAVAGSLFGPADAVIGQIQHMLSVYAVAILAFIGAIHWGACLAGAGMREGVPAWAVLVWSVMPGLYGWVVVSLIDLPRAFGWLAGGFAVAWIADRIVYGRLEAIPSWFIRLRTVLTGVVVCSLVAASIAP